jgi:hypothetical protein
MSTERADSILQRHELTRTNCTFGKPIVVSHSFHLWLLLTIAVITLVARLLLREHYSRERFQIEAKARTTRARDLLGVWRQFRFSEGDHLADRISARVPWMALGLNPMQRELAEQRLKDVLAYLADPSFAAYYRLKTEGVHFRFRPNLAVAKVLGITNVPLRELPPRDAVQAVWNAAQARSTSGAVSKLTSVCLESIAAITSSTNSVPTVIGGKLFKWVTIGFIAYDPGFNYETVDSIRSPTNQIFLNLSFYARSSTSTNPGPIHLSLYWSQADTNWALSRMVTDVHLNMNTLF